MNRLKIYAAMFAIIIGLTIGFNRTAAAQVCVTNPVVISASDSGPGTLRQAVADACAGSTITFSPSMPTTIALFSGGISIGKNITIAGPGAELMTIRMIPGSGSNDRIFGASLNVTAGISGLTLTGSTLSAVNNAGNLTLTDMVITGNTSPRGGGVFNSQGTLTIIRTLISNNGGSLSNPATSEGGGIYVFSGTVDVIDSVIANNFAANGGGIYNAAILTLTRSTITGNIASFGPQNYDGEGGGIYNRSTATLVNTDVQSNKVGACFSPTVSCNLSTTTYGSGIYRGGGSLTLINSTVPDGIRSIGGSFSNQNSYLPDSGATFGGGTVPNGTVNVPYNATLVANTNGFTYSLFGGALPPGITLNTNGSVVSLSGITDKAGRFDFSVKGTDGSSTTITYYSFRFSYPPPPPNICITNPVVTSGANSGSGSFRQAISDACPGSTITFSFWVTGTISDYLTLNKNLTITGPGAGLLEVNGFRVNSNAVISGLKISRNGIYNTGTLTLTDSTVKDTKDDSGIYSTGNLTVTNSIIENNGQPNPTNPFNQGALKGGGIYSESGTLSIINSTVRNNYAYRSGGGVWNGGGSTMTMTNSTVSGNSSQSSSRENYGGGISNYGTATLTSSTISGNLVGIRGTVNGGGIFNEGTMSLVNSTIFGNTCNFSSSGGGSAIGYGCGIYNVQSSSASGSVTSRNSIIAGNKQSGSDGFAIGIDYSGTLNSQGYNIIGSTDNTTITGSTTGNILNTNALLAPLANNGGTTKTHALLSGSPAINAGNTATSPATDQRGASRVGTADIGSFELNNSANGGSFAAQLPDGFLQTAYNYGINSDNNPQYNNIDGFTYTLTGGSLPNGLSLTTTGPSYAITGVSISGTPTVSGTFNFSVTATNGTNSVVTNYRLVIQDVFGGYFDSADCSTISGWAWDRRYPNSPVNVQIYADNNLIATVSADQFRQDLLNAGIGNGVHGFSFPTPSNLKDGQPHTIRVRIVSATSDLGSSPKTISCSLPPDLTVTKTHTGNFTQGDTGKTYTIIVSNSGSGATSGTVYVGDALPNGLAATSMSGTGWNCNLSNLTCTRNDALAATGSYPAITLTVNVAANAPSSVNNRVTVVGGGETNTTNNTVIDQTTIIAPPTPGSGTGLRGDYYNTIDLTGASIFNRIDPTVNFDWGFGSPAPGINSDNFSVRWSGQVEPAFTETYTFYTTSDDGVRLWINGVQIIDNWTIQPPTETSATVTLNGGQRYDIRMEYFDATAGAVAVLSWSSPSQPKQIIPADRLYPATTALNYSIAGAVSYGIADVNQSFANVSGVNLNATGSSTASAVSDSSGIYQLYNLGAGGNYTVTPSKTGEVRGINSLDATRIQQHLVGMTTLSANQLIAADTDGSTTVNSLDATRIQQSLVGIQTSNIIGQWKFVPSSRQYNSLNSSLGAENYQAILVGEVSGNWATAASSPQSSPDEEEYLPETDNQTAERFANNLVGDLFGQIIENTKSSDWLSNQSPTEADGFAADIQVSLPSNASGSTGSTVTIPVTISAIPAGMSIESFDFSVFYDPAVLQPATPLAGSNAGTLSANCTVLPFSPVAGRVNVSGSCPFALSTGSGVLYNLTFTVIGAANQATILTFTNPANNANTFQFNNGSPTVETANGLFTVLAPTAANVSVSGRVFADGGRRGLTNATVVMTDLNGTRRTVRTSAFGYFRFNEIEVGQTHIFSVKSKRYSFAPQVVSVNEDLTELNFTPQ